jgi:prepilin-type N-terminal cleavage/methylation domain-containing protein
MLKRNAGFTLIELMIVVVIIGILAAMATSNWLSMQASAKEAAVRSNCHTVQLAAEDFSVRYDGIYAANLADNSPGVTILQLLPRGQLLQNPFTRALTEPVNGAAATQGQTGYSPLNQGGVNVGYVIDGVGRGPGLNTIIRLTNGQ